MQTNMVKVVGAFGVLCVFHVLWVLATVNSKLKCKQTNLINSYKLTEEETIYFHSDILKGTIDDYWHTHEGRQCMQVEGC